MKIKWHSRVVYTLLTYAPVMVIWSMMAGIYYIYMTNYVMILMNPQIDTKLSSRLYLAKLFPNDSYSVGLVFFITENLCLSLMMISMFRTIFMDPGYLPDPLSFEFVLVKKNLEYSERLHRTRSDAGEDSSQGVGNSSITSEEEGTLKKPENINSKRYKFIRDVGRFIEEGPLTSTEFIRYRRNLEKYLNTHPKDYSQSGLSALEIQNISTDDRMSYNYDDVFENFRGIDFNKLILCTTCLRWKVERSHHCKHCGKCVLKMDHHCPWLANCIGFRNYKFFCLTIFYGFISSLMIFLTFWEVVVEINMNYEASVLKCTLCTLTFICNFGLLAFLSWLFYSNWTLLFTNQTTIEKCDKERFATTGIKSYNYFDQGCYRNFTSVFGSNPLFWLFPLAANYKGEGVIFDSV